MNTDTGITNLQTLINCMEPVLNEGEYVFVSVPSSQNISREHIIAEFKEQEGITLILSKENAETYQLSFEYVAAWITLNVHSSLNAVGLTAAFSGELAKHSISCNVMAGYYHDHIFIDKKYKVKALEVLKSMSKTSL